MFTRYAIYYTPQGTFASAGAAWLGWDMATAQDVAHPVIEGLDLADLTTRPRKYGFHATVKAPFVLAEGMDVAALHDALYAVCAGAAPVRLNGLEVAALGRFLALVPLGDQSALREMAAGVVQALDRFRAAPSDEELVRRRKANLSVEQEENLVCWGYPHVMDQFRFHMTLTGPVPRGLVDGVHQRVAKHFTPALPAPFVIDSLTLAGERPDGRFELITRVPFGETT